MAHDRYPEELYRPGEKTTGHTITRFNQEVQDKYDGLMNRKRELVARRTAADNEQDRIRVDLGRLVADGADHEKYTDRLTELGAEVVATDAGIAYLDGCLAIMKRVNNWLK